jgi:hypothetical protein
VSATEKLPEHLIVFVNTVFAVVIGVSLTNFFDKLMQEDVALWSFETLTLAVTYIAIVYSWTGYHRSVDRAPHKGRIGNTRFAIDLVILLTYLVLVYFFESFPVVIAAYLVVFVLYFLWGGLKMWEHHSWPAEWRRYALRLPSLAGSIVIVVLWHRGIHWSWPYADWHFPYLMWLFLCVLWYRQW